MKLFKVTTALIFSLIIQFAYSQKRDSLVTNADSCYWKQKYKTAIKLYSRALLMDSCDTHSLYYRGQSLMQIGNYEAAVKDFTSVEQKGETGLHLKLYAVRNRGDSYYNLEKYNEALADYSFYLSIYWQDYNTELSRSNCYNALGNYEKGIASINFVLNAKDSTIDLKSTLINRANAYIETDSFSNAEKDIKRVEELAINERAEKIESVYGLNSLKARMYFYMDSLNEALICVDKSLKLLPNNIWSHSLRGQILMHMKNYMAAKKEFDFIQKTNSKKIWINNLYGILYMRQGNYGLAIKYFDMHLKSNPMHLDAYSDRATCKNKLKDYDGANKDFSIILQYDTLNGNICNGVAWNKFLLKQFDEGLKYSKRSLKIDSLNSNWLDTYGCLMYGLQKYNEAIEAFNRSIELNPKLANSYLYRGKSRIKLGQIKAACIDLKTALEGKKTYLDGEEKAEVLLDSFCK